MSYENPITVVDTESAKIRAAGMASFGQSVGGAITALGQRQRQEAKERKEVARKQKVIDDRAERERIKEAKRFEGKTEDEVKMIKRKDVVFDQTRSEQITALLDLGLTKKQIKALKYEDDRVNKIIELQDK